MPLSLIIRQAKHVASPKASPSFAPLGHRRQLLILLAYGIKRSLIHRSGFRTRQTQVTDVWAVIISFASDEILAKPPY